eukprot:3843316-Pyramimonas_sp.AAC.1
MCKLNKHTYTDRAVIYTKGEDGNDTLDQDGYIITPSSGERAMPPQRPPKAPASMNTMNLRQFLAQHDWMSAA